MKKVVFCLLIFLFSFSSVSAEERNIFDRKDSTKIGKVLQYDSNNKMYIDSFYYEYYGNIDYVNKDFYYSYYYGDTYGIISTIVGNTVSGKKVEKVFTLEEGKPIIYYDKIVDGVHYALGHFRGSSINQLIILDENYEVDKILDFPLHSLYLSRYYDYYIKKGNDNSLYVFSYYKKTSSYNKNSTDHLNSCKLFSVSEKFDVINKIDCNKENFDLYIGDDFFTYNNWFFPEILESNNDLFSKVYKIEDYYIGLRKNEIVGSNCTSSSGIYTCEYMSNYSDQVYIYDIYGNLLQIIQDNSSYVDIDINEEKDEFVILKKYVDGVCGKSYAGNLSCQTYLSYDTYNMSEEGRIYLEEVIRKNNISNLDKEEVLDEKDDTINNPNTYDNFIIIFIIMFIGSIVFILKKRKIEF